MPLDKPIIEAKKEEFSKDTMGHFCVEEPKPEHLQPWPNRWNPNSMNTKNQCAVRRFLRHFRVGLATNDRKTRPGKHTKSY